MSRYWFPPMLKTTTFRPLATFTRSADGSVRRSSEKLRQRPPRIRSSQNLNPDRAPGWRSVHSSIVAGLMTLTPSRFPDSGQIVQNKSTACLLAVFAPRRRAQGGRGRLRTASSAGVLHAERDSEVRRIVFARVVSPPILGAKKMGGEKERRGLPTFPLD